MSIFIKISENEYIKEAKIEDALSLSRLSRSLEAYLFEEKMPKWFKNELSVKSFEERINSKNFIHYLYIKDQKLVGFISIKNKNHLFHLFVDKNFHKQGIARKLWNCVCENIDTNNMEVNASLYAIKAYESLGFEICDKEKFYLELKFQPMIYSNLNKTCNKILNNKNN
ncbi:GNAT family N-acetyltransferase [Halarcobacter sp.]|uniref:GNAT family N-acetyltransferase n=1 Tax=Halarcobacter sp. TaxID=2321133 RepID=UPI002AAB0937|nr:GNAT family N-acetyltransferase [Halarcobacter sp.]